MSEQMARERERLRERDVKKVGMRTLELMKVFIFSFEYFDECCVK